MDYPIRPPQSQAKCDALIERALDIAALVRGTARAVQLRNCMQWRTDIYSIVTQDQNAAPYIYARLFDFFKRDIRVNFVEAGKKQRDLFQFVANFFKDFKAIAKAIEFAFAYLDQYFTKRNDKDCLRTMIYKTFKSNGYEVIKGALLSSIMTRMNGWRDGENQNLEQLRSSIDFFVTIGAACTPPNQTRSATSSESIFVKDFLQPCIDRSREYYNKLAAKRQSEVLDSGVSNYFEWARKQLAREESLMTDLGLLGSWVQIKEGLVTTLITEPHVGLLQNSKCGLFTLLSDSKDVSGIYTMLELIPESVGVVNMATIYSIFVHTRIVSIFGASSTQDKPEQAELQTMRNVMDFLLEQRKTVIREQFANNAKILLAWDNGVQTSFKENPNVPRLLSDHMDVYLAGAASSSDDEETVGLMLEFFKSVFVCVAQKDEFFANYRASLARRLLRGQFRRTTESQMLSRLKVVSGNAEVYPLNAMVSDIDNSDRLSSDMLGGASMESFLAKEKLKARTILVTAQYWPTFAYMDMRPAPVMSSFITLFEAFYQNRFPNRRIRWVYQSSTGVVNARFTNGPKELSGTLIQSTVLLTIDGTAGMRIPALVEATGLAKESVADAVASMYMNKKVNVLECIDPSSKAVVDTKRITDGLVFRMNLGFRSPVRKLDLPKPRTAKGVDMGQIEALRKVLADVAIVRFMKSRGSAMFAELVDATLADLRRKFDAQPPLVKKQLEGLIDKGMVRRDADDPKRLIYVA